MDHASSNGWLGSALASGNGRLALVALAVASLVLVVAQGAPVAFGQSTGVTGTDYSMGLLAAGIAISGSCLAAGYAVGKAASAAAAALVEKPGTFGPLLILAGLGEGIAIYGLLVAFQILSKIP